MTGSTNGQDRQPGASPLAQYVIGRLPKDYMIGPNDLNWLDLCSTYLNGPPSNESVTHATHEAFRAHPGAHIDPFELLIDAGICDRQCGPRP